MPRPVTLFTGQWADLKFESMCAMARTFGYDGLELACWGDHFEVGKADARYCKARHATLKKHGLKTWAISAHLVGQAVCDKLIDGRHKSILPAQVWGDGKPEGVRRRAAEEMLRTVEAAATLGVKVVNFFSGSSIWHLLYAFPPITTAMIDDGYRDFAKRWRPIFDAAQAAGVRLALEVHPTEIAFDSVSAQRALEAVDFHPAFGFNYDPSHLGYQGVAYAEFIESFAERIYHVHIKDVWWSETPRGSGVFGGHLPFGHRARYWDFRSPGRGAIDFEAIIRALNAIGYDGPLSVEWEDAGMDRAHGAAEASQFVRDLDFAPSKSAFDAAFDNRNR